MSYRLLTSCNFLDGSIERTMDYKKEVPLFSAPLKS